MNNFARKRTLGFTIIELMIVLVIVAILLALAYPSYIDYVRKSKRGDAQQMLMNWSVNQEIWRSNNTSYAGDGDITPPCSQDGADCEYGFTVTDVTATTYTLRATALAGNDQENDKARNGTICNPIGLNHNGQKFPPECWQ